MVGVKSVFLSLVLLGVLFSSYIDIVEPKQARITENQEFYLGTVAPGQTIDFQANPVITEGGKFGTGGNWDQIVVDAVPSGWSGEDSKIYERPLKAKIKVSPTAPDGEYEVTLKAVDEGNLDRIGNLTFKLKINVSKEVFNFNVGPESLETGASQPARIKIRIDNTGYASEVFEVYSEGFPAWNYKKYFHVPYLSQADDYYEIVINEEKTVRGKIIIKSTSSSLITYEKNVTVSAKSNVYYDYKATSHGILLFPFSEQIIYSLISLISQFI